MQHSHTNINPKKLSNAFKTGIALNLLFVAAELFFGYVSNSMALVADAWHNLSDVLALAFAWIAIILSQRKPTLKFTYGFRRSTILIALLNTLFLLSAVAFIAWEAVSRLKSTPAINTNSVIIVAAIGIVINGFTVWLFIKGKEHDINIRSAFVHFFADTLVSFGVVLAGVIMALTGLLWIDSLVSFIIIAVILYSVYHLLIDSINLALDAVPENINIAEVRTYLMSLPEVSGIHDLHIWALSTTDAALTVHLRTKSQTDIGFITTIQQVLDERFAIHHATIQVEFGNAEENDNANCNEC